MNNISYLQSFAIITYTYNNRTWSLHKPKLILILREREKEREREIAMHFGLSITSDSQPIVAGL